MAVDRSAGREQVGDQGQGPLVPEPMGDQGQQARVPDGGEVVADVQMQPPRVISHPTQIGERRPVRPAPATYRETLVDETALVGRPDAVEQGALEHPVAHRRGGDDAHLGIGHQGDAVGRGGEGPGGQVAVQGEDGEIRVQIEGGHRRPAALAFSVGVPRGP
jgi:hypothetical protein